MKPEPLIKELKCDDCGAIYANVIRTWDLHHRIEWLEKKIGESNDSDTICMSKGELYEWIDEAFENVIKKRKSFSKNTTKKFWRN